MFSFYYLCFYKTFIFIYGMFTNCLSASGLLCSFFEITTYLSTGTKIFFYNVTLLEGYVHIFISIYTFTYIL